jgi:DtxR family transcriptional regulator, Mn-dependent transcriptional regulator
MSLSENKENYLEIIYLLEKEHGHAHVRDIAEKIKIRMPSVTEIVRKLKAAGLVNYEKYGPVTLTPKGKKIAQTIINKHRTLYEFLTKVLKISSKTAEKDACAIEHHLSDETFVAIKEYIV